MAEHTTTALSNRAVIHPTFETPPIGRWRLLSESSNQWSTNTLLALVVYFLF